MIDSSTDTYVYDETWKDKLINYNGQSITYDTVGNSTNYMGNTLSWTMGRQLASFGDISYTYNENGIRTSKTSNGVTTKYYLDGTRLVEQTDGTNTLHFNYDRHGEVIGFTHYYLSTGVDDPIMAEYIYVKNAKGDVIGITNPTGKMKVSYTYDPWGRLINVESNFDQYERDVSALNPFRYRSYYYDNDIQMYYLQSRYYDPEIGRFINSDDVNYIDTTGIELSYNAFVYCGNNPVNGSNITGYCYYNAYGYWSHDNWEYTGNYKRKSDPYTKFTSLNDEQKIFVATICGEAIGCGVAACRAVAWVIVNRIGVREWKNYKSAVSIIKNTGFDGYKSNQYNKAMRYLNNRNSCGRNNKAYENVIAAVMPIYKNYKNKTFKKYYDISQGAVLFYSPYIPKPKWNYTVLTRVYISGVSSKDFIFYKYK